MKPKACDKCFYCEHCQDFDYDFGNASGGWILCTWTGKGLTLHYDENDECYKEQCPCFTTSNPEARARDDDYAEV